MLWQAFNELGRPGSDSGFNYISQQEIQSWQANHKVRLTSWEIDTLLALDRVAAAAYIQHQSTKKT